jgi:hypothetical protein
MLASFPRDGETRFLSRAMEGCALIGPDSAMLLSSYLIASNSWLISFPFLEARRSHIYVRSTLQAARFAV